MGDSWWQGCTTYRILAPGMQDKSVWGNGERMRKWRENEETERDSRSTFPHFLFIFSPDRQWGHWNSESLTREISFYQINLKRLVPSYWFFQQTPMKIGCGWNAEKISPLAHLCVRAHLSLRARTCRSSEAPPKAKIPKGNLDAMPRVTQKQIYWTI